MVKCPHCEKKMPENILPLHISKRHSGEPKNEPVESGIPVPPEAPEAVVGPSVAREPWYMRWDAGEITTCAQCKTEWPSKIMGFHLKMDHGL